MDPRLKIIIEGNPEEELHLLIRLEDRTKIPPKVKCTAQFGDIISCRLKRKYLSFVYKHPTVKSIKAPTVVPVNEYDENRVCCKNVKAYNESDQGRQSDVIFGIIDFGFDFTHPDFIDFGRTKFEKIWVQSQKPDFPNKYGYGRIICKDQIEKAIRNDFPFKYLNYYPGANDILRKGMHGTHVTGIACSNGTIGRKGFASDSSIIAVDMGSNYSNGSDISLGDSVKIVEAIDFIISESKGAPVVINMSLGGQSDFHTGQNLVELAIDNLLQHRNGTAIIQSCGNYFLTSCHYTGEIKQSEHLILPWLFKRKDITPNEMEVFYEGSDIISVTILDEDDNVLTENKLFGDSIICHRNDEMGIILHRQFEPNTGKNHIDILTNGALNSSMWKVVLFGHTIKSGRIHAYIERDDPGQSCFPKDIAVRTHTTNSICNSRFGITVGAYNQKSQNKEIMPFSSSGPTIDGRMKPEIIAPGNEIESACSAFPLSVRSSGKLCKKSGSSMAAPYVASLVVKILEKYPNLSIHQIRDILFSSCTPFHCNGGQLDFFRAGNGYLNARKLLMKL